MINIDESKLRQVGRNIKAAEQGNLLVLVIDTTKALEPSKSGRMELLATTGGFAWVTDDLKANINIGK